MKVDSTTATNAYIKLFPNAEEFGTSFQNENDENNLFEHLNFAEQLFPEHGIMLCPVSHKGSKYVSRNCGSVLGYSYSEVLKMELNDFFSLIHPEDLPQVHHCLAFIKKQQPFDPIDHRFSMYYRIKDKDGNYAHIIDEKLATKTLRGTYVNLILFSNISDIEKFHHVKLDVHTKRNGKFIKSLTYNPKQQQKDITPRQNDIVQLILKGFSNQEIADKLSVSIFTIKNHKRMLFKKVNVKNSIELANYVRQTT